MNEPAEELVAQAERGAQRPSPQLKLVAPSTDPNLNVFLYGRPKTGKTIAAASAPKPLLYLNADRTNATRMAHQMYEFDEAKVEGLETLMATMHEVRQGKYRTVVVDPMVDVYRSVLEGLSGRATNPPINLRGDTTTHLERFCRTLCDEPINAVFVAHEMIEKNEDEGGIEYIPLLTSKSGSSVFAGKLAAMVDVIGYTRVVVDEGTKQKRYVAQLISGAGKSGGDRTGALGDLREMDLTEWVDLAAAGWSGKQAKSD